jgi:hypothetical protein
MLTAIKCQVKDSKKKNRSLIILSAIEKPSGLKVARIQSDNGKTYFTRVRPDGTGTCTCDSRRPCYHMTALLSAKIPTYAEVTAFSLEECDTTFAQALTNVDRVEYNKIVGIVTNDDYSVLGSTKKPENSALGSCGHIVYLQHAGELCGACLCK